jgi:hypothetical protein
VAFAALGAELQTPFALPCLFFSPPPFPCQIKYLCYRQHGYQQGNPQNLWTNTHAKKRKHASSPAVPLKPVFIRVIALACPIFDLPAFPLQDQLLALFARDLPTG